MRLRTRHVALALSVVVVTALTVGTGGFSSMSADRGVSIAVADDENAYLGIREANKTGTSGEKIPLLTLTNRFATELTKVDVSVTNSDTITKVHSLKGLSSGGGSGTVMVTIECSEDTNEMVTVKIEVAGGDTAVEKEKTDVPVGCTASPNGNQQAAALSSADAPQRNESTTDPARRNGTTASTGDRTTAGTPGTTTRADRTPEDTSTTEDTPTTATAPTTENESTDVTPTSTAADEGTNASSP